MAPRPSEPVRPQQCSAEIDEQARRYGEPNNEIEHGSPSHPFGGADTKREGRKTREAEGDVDQVQHGVTP
jgi:hypothetical protein